MLSMSSRRLLAVAALLLVAVFGLPLWSVTLQAPQYPEGLGLRIWLHSVSGVKPNDLGNINNLNHYIGMQRIEGDAIPELQYMPIIVGALVVFGLAAALSARRTLARAWVVAFALLAAAGLADLYRWGYNYGHNLDMEQAIIKIPGMAYQPPLIGTKQLLNFRASSWPSSGGGVMLLSLALGLLVVARETQQRSTIQRSAASGPPPTEPAP